MRTIFAHLLCFPATKIHLFSISARWISRYSISIAWTRFSSFHNEWNSWDSLLFALFDLTSDKDCTILWTNRSAAQPGGSEESHCDLIPAHAVLGIQVAEHCHVELMVSAGWTESYKTSRGYTWRVQRKRETNTDFPRSARNGQAWEVHLNMVVTGSNHTPSSWSILRAASDRSVSLARRRSAFRQRRRFSSCKSKKDPRNIVTSSRMSRTAGGPDRRGDLVMLGCRSGRQRNDRVI